jgi:hypothetical protein
MILWEISLCALTVVFILKNGNSLPMENEFYYDKFPPDFKWGAATAAYQVEGGLQDDGDFVMYG